MKNSRVWIGRRSRSGGRHLFDDLNGGQRASSKRLLRQYGALGPEVAPPQTAAAVLLEVAARWLADVVGWRLAGAARRLAGCGDAATPAE